MIKTILFDLDGTLLPMDIKKFEKIYFKSILFSGVSKRPIKLVKTVRDGSVLMFKNDGRDTNENVFYDFFFSKYKIDKNKAIDRFYKFYGGKKFEKAKKATWQNQDLIESVKILKEKSYTLCLATNPVFPKIATLKRIEWAGLCADDFKIITTFEDNRYCKPNIKYFESILNLLDIKPEETLMVGNDRKEDLCAKQLGIKTYLVTDCLCHEEHDKFTPDYEGTSKDFLQFCKNL